MQVLFDLGTALHDFTIAVGRNSRALLTALINEEFIQSFDGHLELALPFVTQQCAVIANNFDNIFVKKVFFVEKNKTISSHLLIFYLIFTWSSFSFQENIRTGVLRENAKLFPTKPPRIMPHITEIILELVTIKDDVQRASITLNSIVEVLEKSTAFMKTFGSNRTFSFKFIFEWQMDNIDDVENVYQSYIKIRLRTLIAHLLRNI